MWVPPVLLIRKKMIIKKLTRCGAFSEESAVSFEQAGVFNPNAFQRLTKRMVKMNILTQTKDGKYYLNK